MIAPVSEEVGVGVGEFAQDEDVDHPELVEEDDGKSESGDKEVVDVDEDVEEAVRPIALRNPGQPTKREREEHELTHQPPRPWCDECNDGRGQHDHHQSIQREDALEELAIPTVSLDYCFLGDNEVRAARNPILVVYDNKSKMIGAWQTYEKGAVDWVAKEVATFISMIGYGQIRVTLKSDGEPAIVALKKLPAGEMHLPL